MVYLFLLVGLLILLMGGKYLVDGASAIAGKLGLSPGLIGLTVVSFGTSAPELLVSVSAALKGNSDIALGNVIGSNISNISLVLGVSAVIFPISLPKSVIKLDYVFTLVVSILFYLLAINGIISLMEGIILVTLLILINFYFFKKIERIPDDPEDLDMVKIKETPIWKSIALIILGMAGLYWGSDLFIENSIVIAQTFGISDRVIGVTIIAMGTSLPELVTSVMAALKKHTDIALGNILGSNLMNILAIVGITAIVSPIQVSQIFLQNDFIWMLGFTIILLPIILTKLRISRWEGGLLAGGYGLYIYLLL
ncbi:calcium/sodium antiporter [Litoribacter alkaliphilus]|uniref:Calcium/sodium antiporter n=1 Tax=Litoribacter ruber TaxID=702568 RepID=A0AAP2CE27_9BACT|nr:calcium/sodium antiporter [Litoribacter alkaliphilus]MBS9522468.1 calcium/sodium antiporter [Litoribacter alkaliphilus]